MGAFQNNSRQSNQTANTHDRLADCHKILYDIFERLATEINFNPLSPKCHQHKISPYNIYTCIKREGNENKGHDHQIEMLMIFNPI